MCYFTNSAQQHLRTLLFGVSRLHYIYKPLSCMSGTHGECNQKLVCVLFGLFYLLSPARMRPLHVIPAQEFGRVCEHHRPHNSDLSPFSTFCHIKGTLQSEDIGGWGGESNREIVSCRACVRAQSRCLVRSGSNLGGRAFPFSLFPPVGLSLFPFVAGAFPFSLVSLSESK